MLNENFKIPILFSLLVHGLVLLFFGTSSLRTSQSDEFEFQTTIFFEQNPPLPRKSSVANRTPQKIAKPSLKKKITTELSIPSLSEGLGSDSENFPINPLFDKPNLSSSNQTNQASTEPEQESPLNKPLLDTQTLVREQTEAPADLQTSRENPLRETSPLQANLPIQGFGESGEEPPTDGDVSSSQSGTEIFSPEKQFKLEQQYKLELRNIVGSQWKLPDFARNKKFLVEIKTVVNKSGNIVSIDLVKESDDELLNIAAKDAVLKAIPFPPMSESFPEGKLIPITFRFSHNG